MLSRLRQYVAAAVLLSLTAAVAMAINVVTLAAPPNAQAGTPYSFTLDASSFPGTQPYFFAVIGSLPPGLALTNPTPTTVTISGTPTTPGTYTFQIQVTDSTNQLPAISGGEVSRYTGGMAKAFVFGPYTFTITVAPAPQGAPISPAALLLTMMGLGAAGIFRMRQLRQS